MNKLNILNLVLFIVVISLAFIIYFSEEQDTRLKLLTDIKPNDISSIQIHHNNHSTSISRLDDSQWQITRPVSVAANNFRISSVLKLINAPIHSSYTLAEIDIDKIGLAQPVTTVQLDETTITFGIINPATNLRYVRMNDAVYTIEDVYFPLISSHFSTLVSLNLLPAGSSIERLVLTNQTISKDDNGLWQSDADISADNIVKILDHWQHNQAFGAHEFMQRDDLGEVAIHLQNRPQAIRYIISDTDPWLILARPELGLEYHLDKEAYEQLIEPIDTGDNTQLVQ